MARWACQTAIDISKSIIEAFPECGEKEFMMGTFVTYEKFLNEKK
jgi:hypothetical protein